MAKKINYRDKFSQELADIFANAGLAQELEQFQFSKSSQTEHGVVKGRDLLDRDFAAAWSVDG